MTSHAWVTSQLHNYLLTRSHRTPTIVRRLQRIANSFVKFFQRWRIKINPSKSEACIFSRKRANRHQPRTTITIEGQQIPWSASIKYLGMQLDKTLTYKQHIQLKIEKCEKAIRTLYPLIGRSSKLSLKHKVLLFKSVLRPAFCYACPVWSMCAAHTLRGYRWLKIRSLRSSWIYRFGHQRLRCTSWPMLNSLGIFFHARLTISWRTDSWMRMKILHNFFKIDLSGLIANLQTVPSLPNFLWHSISVIMTHERLGETLWTSFTRPHWFSRSFSV